MSDPFAKWKNQSGTYNGAAMFSELTGIPQDEIVWTAKRIGELRDAGVPKADWTRIVKQEAAGKPWLA